MMSKKSLLYLLSLIIFSPAFSQTYNKKLEELMELDGTTANLERIINQGADLFRAQHPLMSDEEWDAFFGEVISKSREDLQRQILSTYQEFYSRDEVDEALSILSTEYGQQFTQDRTRLVEAINQQIEPLYINWQNEIIKLTVYSRQASDARIPEELYNSRFAETYGIEIVDFGGFTYQDGPMIASYVADFGSVSGNENVTMELVVKNVSDTSFTFVPTNDVPDALVFDLGEDAMVPGEVRTLRFTLDVNQATPKIQSAVYFETQGGKLPLMFHYEVLPPVITYEISADSLPFESFTSTYSNEYRFEVINTGLAPFVITQAIPDNELAFFRYNQGEIAPGATATVSVIYQGGGIMTKEKARLTLIIVLSDAQGRYYIDDALVPLGIY